MSHSPDKRRRTVSLADQDGYVLIEAIVAAFVLILAAAAIYSAYDASTRAAFRAQQSQVELSQAQQELERIREKGYDRIALMTAPDPSGDPASPWYRVTSNEKFNLNRTGFPNYALMVVNGGNQIGGTPLHDGDIDPGPSPFQSGDVKGSIYRFVVWQPNNGCPQPVLCTGQDIKRVIIVVQADTPGGGVLPYVEIHSDFVDPNSHSLSNVAPGGGTFPTEQQFWLSDTPCDPNAATVRQPIAADHDLHNTLGDCGDLKQSGRTPGAPDALLPTGPQGTTTAPTFDYAKDWEPAPPADPSMDKGIQLDPETQASPSCFWDPNASPDPLTDPQRRYHTWLSDEMPPGPPFPISGPVTLSFFSRTINGAAQPGEICAWIFKRSPSGKDTIIGGANSTPSLTYSQDPWPIEYAAAGETPFPLQKSTTLIDSPGKLQVPPHWRLGLTISVASGVPGALEVMYDHPALPSRLQVETP